MTSQFSIKHGTFTEGYDTYTEALEVALQQLNGLRQTLEDLRAADFRKELTDGIQHFRGPMAAFQDELEESQAAAIGMRLVRIAAELEVMDEDEVFSINDLLEGHTRADLDVAYKWLGRAWQLSTGPDSLERQAETAWSARTCGGLGTKAALVLADNFEEVREAYSELILVQ